MEQTDYRRQFEETRAWGLLTAIDLRDCEPSAIRSDHVIRDFVIRLCDRIGMKRFGECVVVNFGEDERVAGYSMTQLIETSLISGHFANADNSVYLDVFSCKAYDPQEVAAFAAEVFGGRVKDVTVVLRGKEQA